MLCSNVLIIDKEAFLPKQLLSFLLLKIRSSHQVSSSEENPFSIVSIGQQIWAKQSKYLYFQHDIPWIFASPIHSFTSKTTKWFLFEILSKFGIPSHETEGTRDWEPRMPSHNICHSNVPVVPTMGSNSQKRLEQAGNLCRNCVPSIRTQSWGLR
jgi:hypothetical protein